MDNQYQELKRHADAQNAVIDDLLNYLAETNGDGLMQLVCRMTIDKYTEFCLEVEDAKKEGSSDVR